ncbi:MAG: glycosyltransferase [Proteobacteria bacterium]|nr:glycosyltransferase [Pseudomonadota bacterium]MBU4469957.1 glycosyltransferase [Pseudomonadota bacterium]MCG2753719.1 glycosyltransferase [Desulfobacteraceae bacterium]
MPNKSICFFNSSKTWGGGEKWHYDMACGLNERGFKPMVISGKNSALHSRIQHTGLTFYMLSISNFSFLNPIKIYKIYKILRHEGIEIIIINLSEDVKVAGIAAKLAGIKHIIYRRGSAIPVRNSLPNRLIFKYLITDIIANSEQTRRTILQNNPELFPMDKITVIYNGIFLEEPEPVNFEPIYQRQGDEIILGNAGRLVPQKGQKYLIQIAKILKAKNINFKLLIAGDGKLLNDLRQQAMDDGVSENVLFLGFVENIKQFMKTIDIFVLTSLWEGFGYVLVEAMAASKPVIAFNVSSNPEIIENNKTGYLIQEMDLRGFVKKIETLKNNRNLALRMGKAGRIHIQTKFDINAVEVKIERFLNSLS